jgi:hypothetical protein
MLKTITAALAIGATIGVLTYLSGFPSTRIVAALIAAVFCASCIAVMLGAEKATAGKDATPDPRRADCRS